MAKKTSKQAFPKTWEEYCKQTGRDPKIIPDVSVYEDRDKKHAIADFKLTLMIRHINVDEVNYKYSGQTKREIWWDVVQDNSRPSGLGLSFYDCAYWHTTTYCGPRFAYLSVEAVEHAVKHWIDLLNDLIL